MNILKKYAQDISDAFARNAFVRGIFVSIFGSQVVAPVTLAINGAGATFAKTTTASFVLVNGVLVKIASGTAMPALTGVSIPNGSKQVIGFVTDVNGNLTMLQGGVAASVGQLTFPALPDWTVAVGYLVIENGTGSTFTGGTTALDTASLTVTYVNQPDGIQPLSVL
jgi:hypothetical protein